MDVKKNTYCPREGKNKTTGVLTRLMALVAATFLSSCASIGTIEYSAGQQAYDLGQYRIARTIWHVAAQFEDTDAQHGLGWLYDKGLGVAVDPIKAAEWYAKAARQNHGSAQLNLGNLFDDGRGVPLDYGKAAKLFQQAAKKGIAEAQNNLGMMYREGHGVTRDAAQALVWLRRAADQGYLPAQNTVGIMYFRGKDVKRDLEKAFFWLDLATRKGQPGAIHNRDFVAAFLTRDVILKIKKRIDTWQPAGP